MESLGSIALLALTFLLVQSNGDAIWCNVCPSLYWGTSLAACTVQEALPMNCGHDIDYCFKLDGKILFTPEGSVDPPITVTDGALRGCADAVILDILRDNAKPTGEVLCESRMLEKNIDVLGLKGKATFAGPVCYCNTHSCNDDRELSANTETPETTRRTTRRTTREPTRETTRETTRRTTRETTRRTTRETTREPTREPAREPTRETTRETTVETVPGSTPGVVPGSTPRPAPEWTPGPVPRPTPEPGVGSTPGTVPGSGPGAFRLKLEVLVKADYTN